MNSHRIEVWYKKGIFDAGAEGVCSDITDLGIKGVRKVEVGSIFLIRGCVGETALRKIARELLLDPVTQRYWLGRRRKPAGAISVEVWFKEGVTDTVGETALKGIKDLGLKGAEKVLTAKRYFLYGKGIGRKTAEIIAGRLLANEVIQTFAINF